MKRYLLDTAILTAYLFGRPGAVALVDPWADADEVVTSILVYGEVIEHLRAQPRFPERRAALLELLNSACAPYFLSYEILDRYADVRRALRPPHGLGLIGDVDTLIAATALEHGLEVVTTDADFQRVPSLKVVLVDRSTLRTR